MVWSRKVGRKVVHYAVFRWQGRAIRERATDKRAAEKLERDRKREVATGVYLGPEEHTAGLSLDAYADRWLARRKTRTVGDDAQRYRDHISPRLGKRGLDELRPRDVAQLIAELKADGLKARTVRNVHSVLVSMLKSAVFEEVLERNVAAGLPRGVLPSPGQRTATPGARGDALRLIGAPELDPGRRALYALLYLGGMRLGEACGRRWRDLDAVARPLWMLHVHDQYEGEPLKTARDESIQDRFVPVHPTLEAVLEAWREAWPMVYKREPGPDDFISPDPGSLGARTKNQAIKALYRDCARLGMERRGTHSGRRWFVTYSRADGARTDLLERVTHNAAGTMIDRYTYFGWPELCAEVAKLRARDHANDHTDADRPVFPVEAPGLEGGSGRARMRKSAQNGTMGTGGAALHFPEVSSGAMQTITRVIVEYGLDDTPRLRRAMADLAERLTPAHPANQKETA
jgi:integrase